MSFGSTAKEALAEALKAYKAACQLEARVDSLSERVTSFEARISQQHLAHEQKMTLLLQGIEMRIRDLEKGELQLGGRVSTLAPEVSLLKQSEGQMRQDIASIRARVDNGFTEAIKVTLLDPAIRERMLSIVSDKNDPQ